MGAASKHLRHAVHIGMQSTPWCVYEMQPMPVAPTPCGPCHANSPHPMPCHAMPCAAHTCGTADIGVDLQRPLLDGKEAALGTGGPAQAEHALPCGTPRGAPPVARGGQEWVFRPLAGGAGGGGGAGGASAAEATATVAVAVSVAGQQGKGAPGPSRGRPYPTGGGGAPAGGGGEVRRRPALAGGGKGPLGQRQSLGSETKASVEGEVRAQDRGGGHAANAASASALVALTLALVWGRGAAEVRYLIRGEAHGLMGG